MTGRWLGHRDLCPSQNGHPCDCPCSDIDCPGINVCVDDCIPPRWALEQRPEDDPPDPIVCDGRNCGGVPHG